MGTVLYVCKQGKKEIISILKKELWIGEIIEKIKIILSAEKMSNAKHRAIYRTLSNFENIDYKYRCKSLATIFNFMRFRNGKVSLIKHTGKYNLVDFLEDDKEFSIEHFVVPSSAKIKMKDKPELAIPREQAKYNKYLLNFIFIPESINKEIENYTIKHKIEKLIEKIELNEINCEYSKKVVELIIKNFPDYMNVSNEVELETYFEERFIVEYRNYVADIMDALIKRLIDNDIE